MCGPLGGSDGCWSGRLYDLRQCPSCLNTRDLPARSTAVDALAQQAFADDIARGLKWALRCKVLRSWPSNARPIEVEPKEREVPLCSLTDSFSREQPIAAALRTLCPSTGLELTPMGLGPSQREAVRPHGEDASHQSHARRPGTRANSESWRTRCRYATPESSRNFPHPGKPADSAHPTNSGPEPEEDQKLREAWRLVPARVGHNRNQRRPRL